MATPLLQRLPTTTTTTPKTKTKTNKRKRGEGDPSSCYNCGLPLSTPPNNNNHNHFGYGEQKKSRKEQEEELWLLLFCVCVQVRGEKHWLHVDCFGGYEDNEFVYSRFSKKNKHEEPNIKYIDCSSLNDLPQQEIEKLCQKVKRRDLANKETDKLQKKQFLSPLSSSLSSQPPLYYVDGVISPPPSSLRLYYVEKEGEGEDKGKARYFDLPFLTKETRDKEMNKIMLAGSTASFGRDGESITDTSYRNAKCLSPPSFSLSWSPPHSMLSMIESVLLRGGEGGEGEGGRVRCELYKLNVYGEGGLFRSHVDTPTSESMFGSLVVCLPVEFEGGELIVRKRSHEVTKKWGKTVKKQKQDGKKEKGEGEGEEGKGEEIKKGMIQWIAFYGDCEHEILPVASGFRVTLTYRLFGEGASSSPLSSSSPSSKSTPSTIPPSPSSFCLASNEFTLLFRKFLADPLFLTDGGKIGIYTFYAYPHTSKATQPLLSTSPHLLFKGLDALIFSFFRNFLSLETEIVPVYPSFPGKGLVIGASFQAVSSDSYYSDMEGGDYNTKLNLKEENEMIFWLNVPNADNEEIGEVTPVYGNEPSVTLVYSHCALIINVPPFFDPVRAALMQ